MKLAIGFRIQDGPWGGGNRFVQSLAQAARDAGWEVVFHLDESDVDVILLMDPRSRSPNISFSAGAILRYLIFRNPRALVVHRINECDERKGTRHMNAALVRANWCADFTVFVGSWLVDLPTWKRHLRTPHAVILNGTDSEVFNPQGFVPWSGEGPMRFVTHHWGGNWMKGFDIYQRFDQILARSEWQARVEFSYVGNLPKEFHFENARTVAPLNGLALAAELKRHHAYITASINEPGGNHQNEGGACGLPLLYRRSGCLPEYCDGFGVSFDDRDFEAALERFIRTYPEWLHRMPEWPHLSQTTCRKYLDLFSEIVARREELLARRSLWQNPWLMLRNQIPI